jgi:hypothetical protein
MKIRIKGYEKAWGAGVMGGTPGFVAALILAALSYHQPELYPGIDAIRAAVVGLVSAPFAAFGAYLATNTPPDAPNP